MRGIDWLPPKLVERMRERRGRLNVFESLVATRTALVVIDMTVLFADNSQATLGVVDNINRLAEAVRAGGGPVAWIRPIPSPFRDLEDAILGKAAMDRYRQAEKDGDPGSALHAGLAPLADDIQAIKRGYSAFFPGASDLPEMLQTLGVDTVLITGAVSNVCCEASARDAFVRGFRVVMLADANIGQADEHRAALAAIYRNYGDVRTTEETVDLLRG